MKCPNCGAELQNDNNVRFCPYCGHKVEIARGAVESIIDEIGKHLDYQRTHADEIEERKKKQTRETLRQAFLMLLVVVTLIGGIIAFTMHMAAEEKKAQPASSVYILNEVA